MSRTGGFSTALPASTRRAFNSLLKRWRGFRTLEDGSNTVDGNTTIDGQVTIGGDTTVDGALSVDPSLTISATDGPADLVLDAGGTTGNMDPRIRFLDDGVTRWNMRMDESSDVLHIRRNDSSGVYQDTPLEINGSNGDVSIHNNQSNDLTNLSQPPYGEFTIAQASTGPGDVNLTGWATSVSRGGVTASGTTISLTESGVYTITLQLENVSGGGSTIPTNVWHLVGAVSNASAPGVSLGNYQNGTSLTVSGTTLIRANSSASFVITMRGSAYTRRHRLIVAKVANY